MIGIDPNRIIVGGTSAGGHISALATMSPHLDDPADLELVMPDNLPGDQDFDLSVVATATEDPLGVFNYDLYPYHY